MKKRYIFPAIFLVLVSVAGVFWWVSRSAESSKNEPQITTPQPSNEEVVVTLSLPGTDPLDARVEDYNDPASLWVVVNKDHPLSNQSYRPSDLMLLADKSRTDKNNDERSIRAIAVNDFTDFITAAKSAGYDLMIGSGFRSYDLQAYYHNSSVSA